MINDIDPDLPIRLAGIIPIMFPLGGMTPSGLRKEAARGRPVLMRIAGKDFTAINAVREMLRICALPRPPSEPVVDRAAQPTNAETARMAIERLRAIFDKTAPESGRAMLAARRKKRLANRVKD
jgi:hypothetical protein